MIKNAAKLLTFIKVVSTKDSFCICNTEKRPGLTPALVNNRQNWVLKEFKKKKKQKKTTCISCSLKSGHVKHEQCAYVPYFKSRYKKNPAFVSLVRFLVDLKLKMYFNEWLQYCAAGEPAPGLSLSGSLHVTAAPSECWRSGQTNKETKKTRAWSVCNSRNSSIKHFSLLCKQK